MPGFFEDLIRFFQEPPPEDWKYRDKGLLQRGAEALTAFGGPREGSPYIMGSDPLYELVNSAKRRMLESNPIAEPGPEQPVVYPQDRINVDQLQKYSGPNLIDTRAQLYRDAYGTLPRFEPTGNNITVDPLQRYSGPNNIDTRAELYRNAYGDMPQRALAEIRGGDGSASAESQFIPDPNSPWAPSVQKWVANFPQEALAPSLRTSGSGSGSSLDQSVGPDSGQSMHDKAQAAIAARIAKEEEQAKKDAEAKAYLAKLAEAKAQDDWVRSVGYEPDQQFSNPDKGILMGELAPDAVARIRAQAAKMGGMKGPSPGGGGLTTATMSPEIATRLAERDIWANNQPIRDAEFALTSQQVSRNPKRAEVAAQTLSDMQRNLAIQREQAMKSDLVKSLADSNGKIPFEKAMQLEAAGVSVPYGARGISREDAVSTFDAAIKQAGEDLASFNPLEAVGDPSARNRIVVTRYAASLAELYKQKVANGMNPDAALRQWQEQVARDMMEAGLLNTNEMVGPTTGAQ